VTINPPNDFDPNASYTLSYASGVILDLGGNAAPSESFGFFIDGTAPTITGSTPADNATNFSIDGTITINFSETITDGVGNLEIRRTADGSLFRSIPLQDDWPLIDISSSSISINIDYLEGQTGYYILMPAGGVTDWAGNPFAGISSPTQLNFATGSDAIAPLLVSYPNGSDVPVDSNFVLTFNELIRAGTGNVEIRHWPSDAAIHSIPIGDASQISINGNSLTINPSANLAYSTRYYIVLPSGVIEDIHGNDFLGLTSDNTAAFNTQVQPDTTPPSLSSTNPTDNASAVAVNANIVLTFSEWVHAGAGAIEIRRASNGSLFESIGVTSGQVTFNTNIVTIDPSSNLDAGTSYYVTLASGVIEDAADLPFAGITSSTSLNFTTQSGDATAPTLTSTTPNDNATGVSSSVNLVLRFSENVRAGSGNIEIYKSDGTLYRTISVTDTSQVNFSSNRATINSSTNLASGTSYYVMLGAGVIEDNAGNDFAGITTTTRFNFTTSGSPPAGDTTAPTLSSTNPADNATGVAAGANLVLTFSESVKAGTGHLQIVRADGAIIHNIAVTDTSQATFSGNQLTINPSTDLVAGTGYYILVLSGAVLDLANNPFAGIGLATTFNFTTAAAGDTIAPTLSNTTPADNATSVTVGANIVLTFSESVKAGTGNIQIVRTDGAIIHNIAVTDASQATFSGNQLTLNPATDLAAGTGYYVVLASGVVLDLANNPFAGIAGSTAFNFNTAAAADTTVPLLSSTTPADGATAVVVGSNLVMTFNEAVMAGTGNFVIFRASDNSSHEAVSVTDVVRVQFSGNTVTINPSTDLASGTGYYVSINPSVITDTAGNNYAGISTTTGWNFTTAAAPPGGGLVLTGASGVDTLVGGSGNDVFTGLGAADTLTGAGGADSFVYTVVSHSTGFVRDTITDFDAAADRFDLWYAVTGVDPAITSGALSASTINAGLAASVTAAKLAAFHAVLFTPNSGTLSGVTHLIVDANGAAGYQAGADLVFSLPGAVNLGSLTTADFV
jgi:methionine-rich copper-binding protein CopC